MLNVAQFMPSVGTTPRLPVLTRLAYDSFLEAGWVFYSNLVNNWIQWTPDKYGVFFSQNYKQVWARGFEGSFNQAIKFEQNVISWNAKYNFTPSTNLKSDNSQIIGKQLMYVPLHTAIFNINYRRHAANVGFDWAIRSQYNSDDTGQGLPLAGYSIVNFNFNNTFRFKSNSWRFDFKINNLFNKQYYTYLPTYPMPGRAFYISATYIFNNSNY